MNLRELQAPLKQKYRVEPDAARVVLVASGEVDPATITCRLTRSRESTTAGLHPATGGDGAHACSGEMLLDALVACAGVTLAAVANSMNLPLRAGSVRAEGDWDARGTLGVARDAPVGFSAVRLSFELAADAPQHELEKLVALTERFCVVLQSLKSAVPVESRVAARP